MISKRIREMNPSVTSLLIGKIAAMKAAGEDIISFNAGEPDFQTPEPIVTACADAMAQGKTKYVSVEGILALRQAIAEKLRRDNALEYKPEQIVVTTGAKQALFNAVMAICDPGDEVIVPKPCWVSYVEIIKLAQGVPVLVDTKADYSLDMNAVKQAVTPKTRAIIINTPNNPTGAVYSREDLLALGNLAVAHAFYVIADEVYEKLIYDGNKHSSIGSLSPEIYNQTITINGFSKAFSMTGWRVGYSAAPLEISNAMRALQSHTTSNSTSFIQWACMAALSECDASLEVMRGEFEKRRDYTKGRLDKIPGITCTTPGGAFYLMPDVSAYFGKTYKGTVIKDSVDFCEFVLTAGRVAIVPGAAFEMPNTVRFSYSTSLEIIEKGMDRFEEALKHLQ